MSNFREQLSEESIKFNISDFQERVYILLTAEEGGKRGRYIDMFIMSMIILSVTAVALETVSPLADQYKDLFFGFEILSVSVFTVEYGLRLWSITVVDEYSDPLFGRLRFATTGYMIIDLLAILPFFAGALLLDLRFLRALRLFRFGRVLKLSRYSSSLRTMGLVMHRKKPELMITFSATTILLFVSGSLMYFAEHQAQPEKFSSIPATLWWGVTTLTTVGYGDVYPVTPLGKLLAGSIALLGIGLFALPASILASGFLEEQIDSKMCPHCGEELDPDDLIDH